MVRYCFSTTLGVNIDSEGYLENFSDWNPGIGSAIAHLHGIALTPAHWEILELIQNFHSEHGIGLPMRALVNLVKLELGDEKGRSIYLLKLFPESPVKLIYKIAGLPKPANCL